MLPARPSKLRVRVCVITHDQNLFILINTLNLIGQTSAFKRRVCKCCLYKLHLAVCFCPPHLFFILCSLLPRQDAIICNLPKSSICWDTKHENEAIWCKMEAGI